MAKAFSCLICLAFLLIPAGPAEAQCQRCGMGGQCEGGHSSGGGEWCIAECAGDECTCHTSGQCGPPPGEPWPPSFPQEFSESDGVSETVAVPSELVEASLERMPELYRYLRLMTHLGQKDLRIGPFNGLRARQDATDADEPLYEFVGYTDRVNDSITVDIQFIGHPNLALIQLEFQDPAVGESGWGHAILYDVSGDSRSIDW